MPDPALTIEGKRVRLRSTRKEDLPELVALWNDGDVMKWVGFPAGLGYDIEKASRWLTGMNANPSAPFLRPHDG